MHTTPNGPKRVLLMVTKSNMGGAQKYVFDLAHSMPSAEYHVTVAAGGHGELFQKCQENNIRTIRLPYLDRDISIFKEIKAFFALIKILRKERPDIVHLNSPKMGGLGGLAARVAGIKNVIYTNHGWTFHEDRPLWQKVLIKAFSWIIVTLSHTTIVLSEKEKNDTLRWPFVRNKLTKIPLGITAPEFLEKYEARKKLFEMAGLIDTGQQLFLSIGELTKNKGYEFILDALDAYSGSYIYMIAGTGELRAKFEKRAFLLGHVSNAAQYLKGADMLLLPSIKEGLPYVLLEAGYAGIPVIATNVGGISDLVIDQKARLVPPKDSHALLDALNHTKTVTMKRSSLQDMLTKTLEQYR